MGKVLNITSNITSTPSTGTITLSPTILSNVAPISPWTVKDTMGGYSSSGIFGNNPRVKKYEIIETHEDLLAMSCAWYRIRQEIKSKDNKKIYPTITSLLSNELFDIVTTEDKEKASVIRDYYSKKLMMLTLMEIRLTSFRSDLNEYIQSNGKKFVEKMVPMVYRLPEFYEYDMAFEKIKDKIKPEFDQDSKRFLNSHQKALGIVLHPITSLKRENRKIKGTEYWMKSEDEKYAFCIPILDQNPLKAIWEQIFFTKNKISFNTDLAPHIRDGLHYYNLKNYHLSSFG